MPKQTSPTALKLLAILNNINELIIKSNDRQSAKDVIKAFEIYAREKSFPIPKDKVQNFLAVLIDARPYTLASIIKDIAEDIILVDSKNKKQSV